MTGRHLLTIQVVRTEAGHHIRIKAGNGEPWLTTQRYVNATNARRSARRIAEAFGCQVENGVVYAGLGDELFPVGRIVEVDERNQPTATPTDEVGEQREDTT